MGQERINALIELTPEDIAAMTASYDPSLRVQSAVRLCDGQSNTGYRVSTDKGELLLKVYTNPRSGIECAMYDRMRAVIDVPDMHHCDLSQSAFAHAYSITAFISGDTLSSHIRTIRAYPPRLAYLAGRTCALIHQKKFPHNGALNDHLDIERELPCAREKLTRLLLGRPGTFLMEQTRQALSSFIEQNGALLACLDERCVLCHGDYNYGNLLVSGDTMYCIDFEYACADTPYRDIGHFFRRKSEDIQSLIGDAQYQAFAEGYNAVSDAALPPDWLRLARVYDIVTMLCLFNNAHFPKEWIADIEADILCAVRGETY